MLYTYRYVNIKNFTAEGEEGVGGEEAEKL